MPAGMAKVCPSRLPKQATGYSRVVGPTAGCWRDTSVDGRNASGAGVNTQPLRLDHSVHDSQELAFQAYLAK